MYTRVSLFVNTVQPPLCTLSQPFESVHVGYSWTTPPSPTPTDIRVRNFRRKVTSLMQHPHGLPPIHMGCHSLIVVHSRATSNLCAEGPGRQHAACDMGRVISFCWVLSVQLLGGCCCWLIGGVWLILHTPTFACRLCGWVPSSFSSSPQLC